MVEEINIDELEAEDTATHTHLPIAEQIGHLTKRLNQVTSTLHEQVKQEHGVLLQQASHAGRFDAALNHLAKDVDSLRGCAHRLKSQVDSQYKVIENQTNVLGRLHDLSHLLRSSGTLLQLTAKLKSTKDPLKQAEIHYEIDQLVDDKELKSIEFVQAARTYSIGAGQRVRNLTQMQLVNGLQEKNQTQIVNALKIFMNFNTLEKSLHNLVATFVADLEQSLKECFAGNDISVLTRVDAVADKATGPLTTKANARGPGKTPQLTTTQNFRAKFWKSLHWLLYDELYECCEQIKLLKRSLEQINQYAYVSSDGQQSIHKQFWSAVQKLLLKNFSECSVLVRQTLQEGLSKLLTTVRGLEQRLNGEFMFDKEIFADLEVGYISKCASNMKSCQAGVDLPTKETVDNFIRIASTELSAALIDPSLTTSIGQVIIACGKELCSKLEAQMRLGADSKQVVDLPNFQQTQNSMVANTLYYYKDSVRRMLQDLQGHFEKSPSSAKEDIAASLGQVDLLITTILQQIIDSIISAINVIILSMHREPGLNSDKIATGGPSMFMKELQEFISRSWVNHVLPFDDKEIVNQCGQELAKRCIHLFVHNLSILRPLSNAGRLRLKNDCVYMEQALKPICANFSDLGKHARLLRAMSQLILLQPQELQKQPLGADAIVPSYIILFLLFGHSGPELQSPHTTVNWSNERLIEWLDGHTNEREKLELISGALQRYRDTVRRKNSEQYDTVYPLLAEYFERAVKEHN